MGRCFDLQSVHFNSALPADAGAAVVQFWELARGKVNCFYDHIFQYQSTQHLVLYSIRGSHVLEILEPTLMSRWHWPVWWFWAPSFPVWKSAHWLNMPNPCLLRWQRNVVRPSDWWLHHIWEVGNWVLMMTKPSTCSVGNSILNMLLTALFSQEIEDQLVILVNLNFAANILVWKINITKIGFILCFKLEAELSLGLYQTLRKKQLMIWAASK